MEVKEIPISQITGSLCRMRLERDYEKEEMLGSIKECGLMNPVKNARKRFRTVVGQGEINPQFKPFAL